MSEIVQPAEGAIACSVAAALPSWQGEYALQLPLGATAGMALEAAYAALQATGIRWSDAEIECWQRAPVGIFGETCDRTRCLQSGDRVEVYRPLAVDPKAARRARARERQTGKGRNPLTVKPTSRADHSSEQGGED